MKFYKIESKGIFRLPIEASPNSPSHSGTSDEGRMFYEESGGKVYLGNSSSWILLTTRYDVLSQNTKVLFHKAPIPNNWTISTTDDCMVILTRNTDIVGDDTEGDWVISAMNENGGHSHTLSTAQYYGLYARGGSSIEGYSGTYRHSHYASTGGNHSHSFSGTWRPYTNTAILAIYD